MTNERVQLLQEAADDCEAEANHLMLQAPNMGPTKERSYIRCANESLARAKALRAWADELAAAEPVAKPDLVATIEALKPAKAEYPDFDGGYASAIDDVLGILRNALNRER